MEHMHALFKMVDAERKSPPPHGQVKSIRLQMD